MQKTKLEKWQTYLSEKRFENQCLREEIKRLKNKLNELQSTVIELEKELAYEKETKNELKTIYNVELYR